jgi:hypothetical protein
MNEDIAELRATIEMLWGELQNDRDRIAALEQRLNEINLILCGWFVCAGQSGPL